MNLANPKIEDVELELKIRETELQTQTIYVAGKFSPGRKLYQKETSLALQVTSRFHDDVRDEITITLTQRKDNEPVWLLVPLNAKQALAVGTEMARLARLLLERK